MGVGCYMTNTYEYKPLILKKLLVECGISQSDLKRVTDLSKAAINLAVNRGYIPRLSANFQGDIERFLLKNETVPNWLKKEGLKISDIWQPMDAKLKNFGHKKRIVRKAQAIEIGDPEVINQTEVEMLTGEAMKHFKLFRNPFQNDIRGVEDIYMSDEHRYIEAAMLDAAKNGGFIAVIGEVGSGKSSIRKKVVAELGKDENTRIIYPRMIDKSQITSASLCDAIIMDLSEEKPRLRLEQKTRQVEKLLIQRAKADCHVCLIIEEAHDLTIRVLKLLKRFYEIEHGYKKVLGIVLIGQPELGDLFNEADHYEMREVIRRCQVAYIRGLNGNLRDYLELKFKRVNADLKNIITDSAIAALSKRLKDKDQRQREISKAYPLTVNNQMIRAMNIAFEMGEAKVTEDVINAI